MLRAMNAQNDMNELLAGAVDLATEFLARASEFEPFGLAMSASDGTIMHVAPEDSGPSLDAPEILALLRAELREAAHEGTYRAAALVSDVTVEDDNAQPITSAIRVIVEHHDTEGAIQCVLPYSIHNDEVELDEMTVEQHDTSIFIPPVPN